MEKRMLAFSNGSIIFDFPATSTYCVFFGTFRWSFIDFKSDFITVWINVVINGLEEAGLLRAFGQKLVEKSQSA